MRDDGRETLISLDSFLPYRLSVASNAASSVIARAYQHRFGLSIAEWRLIAILAEEPSMTPQALVTATRMDKIAVSRAAKRLQDARLIMRDPNPQDRRSHFLQLSAKGRALYRQVAPLALELEAKLLRDLSAQDRSTLDSLLRRIEAAASET